MSTPNDNDNGTEHTRSDATEHDRSAAKPGSGKQFAKDVHSPGGEPPAPEGSGKQFTPSSKRNGRPAEDDDEDDAVE